jgi:hypothetical protein
VCDTPCPDSTTIPEVLPVEKRESTAEFIIERELTLNFSNKTYAISILFSLVLSGESLMSTLMLLVSIMSSFSKICSQRYEICSKSSITYQN